MSITIRSSQKLFTEAEVSGLTGICPDHLRTLALCKHLGFLSKAASVGEQAGKWLFTSSDLMVVLALQPRCQH
jgi:hypothetical protein